MHGPPIDPKDGLKQRIWVEKEIFEDPVDFGARSRADLAARRVFRSSAQP
jgi:hypothetical protein